MTTVDACKFPDFNKWHKVPVGATIPPNTPYWTIRHSDQLTSGNRSQWQYHPEGRSAERIVREDDATYMTEALLAAPRPTFPDALGSVIRGVTANIGGWGAVNYDFGVNVGCGRWMLLGSGRCRGWVNEESIIDYRYIAYTPFH